MNNKISLYIATTLDGFIAAKDGSVQFLNPYNNTGEDYGYYDFIESVDSIVMGNTTFKAFGAEFYKGKKIYVYARSPQKAQKNITFVNEGVVEFSKKLKGNVWMLGGSAIFNDFLEVDLIDEFIITVIPVLLGEGIPLFTANVQKKLELVSSKTYKGGVVQVTYKR